MKLACLGDDSVPCDSWLTQSVLLISISAIGDGVGIRPALGPRGGTPGGRYEGLQTVLSPVGSDDVLTCSLAPARSAGRSGPEGFVGLTGLAAPALLGWGLRVTVCAWSVAGSVLLL